VAHRIGETLQAQRARQMGTLSDTPPGPRTGVPGDQELDWVPAGVGDNPRQRLMGGAG